MAELGVNAIQKRRVPHIKRYTFAHGTLGTARHGHCQSLKLWLTVSPRLSRVGVGSYVSVTRKITPIFRDISEIKRMRVYQAGTRLGQTESEGAARGQGWFTLPMATVL